MTQLIDYFNSEKWRAVAASCCVCALACLTCCERSPDAKPIVTPKTSGHRESTYGKAMDSADELKAKVADYNESIEQTIEQGTKAEPPPKKPKSPEESALTPVGLDSDLQGL